VLDVVGTGVVPPLGAEDGGEVGAGGGLLGAQPLLQFAHVLFLGGFCAAYLGLAGPGEHLAHACPDGDGDAHRPGQGFLDAV